MYSLGLGASLIMCQNIILYFISRSEVASTITTLAPPRPNLGNQLASTIQYTRKVAAYAANIAAPEVFINVSTSTNSTTITQNFTVSPSKSEANSASALAR